MDSVLEGSGADGLAALDRQVQDDLTALCYPAKKWIPETRGPNGVAVLDAVIIGGRDVWAFRMFCTAARRN